MKELKVLFKVINPRSTSMMWNPVKELKVFSSLPNKSFNALVESGEGIESCIAGSASP